MALPIGMLALIGSTLAWFGWIAKRRRAFSSKTCSLCFLGGVACLLWVASFPKDHLSFLNFLN